MAHLVGVKLDDLFRSALYFLEHVQAWEGAGVALHLVDPAGSAIITRSTAG